METSQNVHTPSPEEFALMLREKWREIPATRQERLFSTELLDWSDRLLLGFWDECRRQTMTSEVRGWYHEKYKDMLAGKTMADVGPGMGIDGMFYASYGAKVTFVDIVEDNLKLLERICKLKGIEAEYYYIDDFFDFNFAHDFDVFSFIGSMHNAPFEFSKKEATAMMKFLKPGGKILMLAYPRERYIACGAKSFVEFGQKCDGERTPWCEWYDDEKMKQLFGPEFELDFSQNFGHQGIEFNFFEMTKKL